MCMKTYHMRIFPSIILTIAVYNNDFSFFYEFVFFQRYTDEILMKEDPSQTLIPPLQHYLEKPINRIQQYQTIIKVKSICYTLVSDSFMFCFVQPVGKNPSLFSIS